MTTSTKNKQTVVIVEGVDGVGKTQIARGLSEALGIPYFKMPTEATNWRAGRFREALEFDQTYSLEFLRQTGCSVIIDRAWPSEFVYSQVFERETNVELLARLDREFAALGTVIVIPFRDSYADSRHDELVPNDRLQEIHDEYMRFMDWTECETIGLNVDHMQNDLGRELEFLVPLLKRGG